MKKKVFRNRKEESHEKLKKKNKEGSEKKVDIVRRINDLINAIEFVIESINK